MTLADRMVTRSFASRGIPSGWFQIGWSSEFAPGQVLPLRYFNCDLVAYRSESGKVRVLDAYCRHMGAHLGHGGMVEGECIRCPFHGWSYDAEGRGSTTSGANRGVQVVIGAWPTFEVDGLVFVYHDPSGSEPDEPPQIDFVRSADPNWPLADTSKLWPGISMVPQFAADNVCDAAHFTFIHGAHEAPILCDFGSAADRFWASYTVEFGGGMPSTWATPQGPLAGTIRAEAWGLGVLWNRLGGFDDVRSVLGVTPIDAVSSDVRLSVWVPKTRGDGSVLDERLRDRWTAQQRGQVEADFVIWEHQTFIEKPPLLRTEAKPMRAFRSWSRDFYDT